MATGMQNTSKSSTIRDVEPAPKPYIIRGLLVALAGTLILAISADLPGATETLGKILRGPQNPTPTPTQTTTRTPNPPINSRMSIK